MAVCPVVFAISAGGLDGLPPDPNQRLELLITAAQSLFAVSILVNLGLTVGGVVALFTLYAVLAIGQVVRRHHTVRMVRDGVVTPLAELERKPS